MSHLTRNCVKKMKAKSVQTHMNINHKHTHIHSLYMPYSVELYSTYVRFCPGALYEMNLNLS
jgi:hypothetical protein